MLTGAGEKRLKELRRVDSTYGESRKIHRPKSHKGQKGKSSKGKGKATARQGENVARGIHRTIPLRKANIRWRWLRGLIAFGASCGPTPPPSLVGVAPVKATY